MKSFHQVRNFAWPLSLFLLHQCIYDLAAGVVAYDGAAYSPTTSINGLVGGIGWNGGWLGGDNVEAGSLIFNGVATNGNHFSTDGNSGSQRVLGRLPVASLLEATDHALYGTCSVGGARDVGTVFKVNKDGSGYLSLHDMTDAANPLAPLIEGKDGALYGTAHNGGALSLAYGAIFKLNKDGSNYVTLKGFPFNSTDGRFPDAPLLQGSDLELYGVTSSGGANGVGTIFKLNTDGSGFSYIHVCKRAAGDVSLLESGLIEGSDGRLYGISQASGFGTVGAVFRLDKDGNNFTVLGGVGGSPYAPLLEWNDGMLYGVTSGGGIDNAGTLFRLNKDGSSYEVLHIFRRSGLDGQLPFAGLIRGTDGGLYGTTSGGGYTQGTVFGLKAARQETKPPLLTARLLSNGSLRVAFQGLAQHNYLLQTADTLSTPNWQSLGSSVSDPSGLFLFDDTNTPNHVVRFYRVVTP